jgi:hypothetical protein
MSGVPFVEIDKVDGQTGVPSVQSPVGVVAIIAPCSAGPSSPQMSTKPSAALATFQYGMLTALFALIQPVTKKPCVLVKANASTPGAYGTIVYTGTGLLSGSVTGDGTSKPVDDFIGLAGGAVVKFIVGGTTGTAGITYQTSIDARDVNDPAKVWSGVQALGTALFIVITGPRGETTGIKVNLVTGKTVVAGDYFVVPCTGPRCNSADIAAAEDALMAANIPWEGFVAAGIDASTTDVANADTKLTALEQRGRYRMFVLNTRPRAQDGSETQAAYDAAMATAFASSSSIRGCVCADAHFLTDAQYSVDMQRPASWSFVPWLFKQNPWVDAAETDLGSLPNGARLYDEYGNPVYTDADVDGSLDANRFVTLRTWANSQGTYICNPRAFSPAGSDYVFAQHIRVMNRACELAFSALKNAMSRGIFPDLKTGFIREDYAQNIERECNASVATELDRVIPGHAFALSRDDALPQSGATLTGVEQVVMPVYIKGIKVNAVFKKTISVSSQPATGA